MKATWWACVSVLCFLPCCGSSDDNSGGAGGASSGGTAGASSGGTGGGGTGAAESPPEEPVAAGPGRRSAGAAGAAGSGGGVRTEHLGTSPPPVSPTFEYLDVEGSDVVVGSHGSLWHVATSGGTVTQIANPGGSSALVDVEGGYAYTLSDLGTARLRRVPVGGGNVEDLDIESMNGKSLDVDGDRVFWSSGFEIRSVGTTGTNPVDYGPVGWGTAIVGFNGFAYYSDTNFTELQRVPAAGGSAELVDGNVKVTCLVDNDTQLFYATDSGTVGRIDDKTLVPLTNAAGEPADLAVDATHLYWIDDTDGAISRIPVGGGNVEPIETVAGVKDIAVNGGDLYWVTDQDISRKKM